MRKDGSDSNPTVPPPAGGDVYAAETMIGKAPVDVLATFKNPEVGHGLGPDDVATIVLAPTSETRPVSDRREVSPEPVPSEDSRISDGPEAGSWVLPILVTVLICALMFLLGRLL